MLFPGFDESIPAFCNPNLDISSNMLKRASERRGPLSVPIHRIEMPYSTLLRKSLVILL